MSLDLIRLLCILLIICGNLQPIEVIKGIHPNVLTQLLVKPKREAARKSAFVWSDKFFVPELQLELGVVRFGPAGVSKTKY